MLWPFTGENLGKNVFQVSSISCWCATPFKTIMLELVHHLGFTLKTKITGQSPNE
jgi:hypothetical protein